MSRIDTSSLFAIFFVAALAVVAYLFKIEIMDYMRLILENGYLKSILLILVAIIVISHSIKVKPGNDSSNVMIRSGLIPIDISLTLGTYFAVTTTACSLLEGSFIQNFYDVQYFIKFKDLDIYVLLGVSALLLWYVAFHMYKMLVELLFKSEEISMATNNLHNNLINRTENTTVQN